MLPNRMLRPKTWTCHESLAHSGPFRCYLETKEDIICNNMVCRIRNIPKTCHIRQTAKAPNLHSYIEQQGIMKRGKSDLLCIDSLRLLPLCPRRLRQLKIFIDTFTKNVRLYLVTRPITKEVLHGVLRKHIPENGIISRVLSDQGKQFQNVLWADTLEKERDPTNPYTYSASAG